MKVRHLSCHFCIVCVLLANHCSFLLADLLSGLVEWHNIGHGLGVAFHKHRGERWDAMSFDDAIRGFFLDLCLQQALLGDLFFLGTRQ